MKGETTMGLLDDVKSSVSEEEAEKARRQAWVRVGASHHDFVAIDLSPEQHSLVADFIQSVPTCCWNTQECSGRVLFGSHWTGGGHFTEKSWAFSNKYVAPDGTIRLCSTGAEGEYFMSDLNLNRKPVGVVSQSRAILGELSGSQEYVGGNDTSSYIHKLSGNLPNDVLSDAKPYGTWIFRDGTVFSSHPDYPFRYNAGPKGPYKQSQSDREFFVSWLKELLASVSAIEKSNEDAKQQIIQSQRWQANGLCRHCGGRLSLLGRKCKQCGEQEHTVI
jgi:ribosomal protein L40E